jgi:adenosylmethionine-8-amino-7-oxononanoate aminotransferase
VLRKQAWQVACGVLLQVAHAPGLELSHALLSGPLGAGWASRVFFSDDGSTAVSCADSSVLCNQV